MDLFRRIQEYIALDANNITLVFDSGNIVNISSNIFLYPLKAIEHYIIVFLHVVAQPGTYSVTVTGVNGLGDKSKTVTVIIVDNVETSCSLPAITGPGETNVIKCQFARFTADTCLCTDTLYNGNAYAGDELCYGPTSCQPDNAVSWFSWLCFASHRQRGHLETATPFTVPCEGREAR